MKDVAADAFDRLLAPTLETDVRAEAKRKADTEAIKVFQTNLDHLLLAPPAGQRCTLGVDPGIRTGCKLAVINRLGQFMESATIYPLEPKRDLEGSRATLETLCAKYPIESVAVGNGTGGREAEAFLKAWIQDTGRSEMVCVSVSESGASVYSASDIAREEFPEQDVTVRGAISIARRFQDPLSELVKVDPKSIGVGQYQHDVNQTALRKSLDEVVESCVNRVGVDLNSASYRLLSYVAGIGEVLAKHIVEWRYQNGAFRHREQLLQVPRFGDKAFQQSAGFLRIQGAENPLDASAVHPESYGVVQRICQHVGKTVPELVGNEALLDALDPALFVDERFGVETVRDILQELRKPGRDPRASFANVAFQEGVRKPEDLQPGMDLDGVVTNVTDFGAFVDVGVHQDGLVHLSEISHRYVKNPADVLAVGQNVRVKVLGVELKAKRISLSIKALLPAPGVRAPRRDGDRPAGRSTPTPDKAERAPKARPPRSDRERRPRGEGERSRPAPPAREPKAEAPLNASLDELMARYNRGLK